MRLMAPAGDLDRALGALLGLAAGDAVGTTLEFRRPGTFEPIDDMVGGGPFRLPAGAWTDDTSMALCLAESLLDTGDMDLADQLRRYLLWADHGYLSSTGTCFDIGTTTRTQLARFRRTGEPVDPDVDDDSAANGSLMRLAPVAIRWHADPAEASTLAGRSSRSTHPARRPVDACRLLGAILAALIGGRPFEEVAAAGFWADVGSPGDGGLTPAVAAIAEGGWKAKAPPAVRGSGYCVDALEAALWAVHGADDLRHAILRAANLGDDADTSAAIAGQIAGARFGATAIPTAWQTRLVAGDRIDSLARWLHHAGAPGGPGDEARWPYDDLVHAWWVEPGRLLAGEYPGHPDAPGAEMKLDVLVDAGIRTFVDLTTPEDHLEPYQPALERIAAARQLELRRLALPIPDGATTDDDRARSITRAVDDALGTGPVYVHCWGGVGRTGTIIGCRLADQGLAYPAVLDHLGQLREGTAKASRPCPEVASQRDQVRRFCDGRHRGA